MPQCQDQELSVLLLKCLMSVSWEIYFLGRLKAVFVKYHVSLGEVKSIYLEFAKKVTRLGLLFLETHFDTHFSKLFGNALKSLCPIGGGVDL